MASAKLRKYNAIPRGDDKKVIDALTRIAETLTGATGDKLEKALTLRDLEALDLITIQKGLNKQGSQFTNIVKVGNAVTEADFPSKPVNFGAVGTYSNILLSWDTPTYKGHSTTEVYRSDTDVLGEAVFIASTISSLYGDPVGTNSSYYYWIRHVNINGDKGPYNDTSGVFAETAPDVEYLLEQLTDQINTSHLAVELRDDIDWISKPDGLRDALFSVDGVMDTLFDVDGVVATLFDTDGVLDVLNRPDTGVLDRLIEARSDIQNLGVDTSLLRNGSLAANNELLNLGSAIHDFRKGYEERVASSERLIDASVYIDPDSGLIINRAFSYTDQSFTNAEILINGVDGKIDLAVERVEELEDKATLATSSIELLAGEIDLRATYSEVNTAVASGIASLIPKYSFQFNSDVEGFTGVSHNASGWISSTAASPAVSPTISYVIEDYPTFRMLVRLQTGGTWNGEITAGSEVIPVQAPSIEDSWEIITVKATSTGTITSLTFDLGDADIDFIEIAKQGSNDLALEGLTARVTIAETNISAIDGTYITGIITTWYDGGAVITSDVNTLINSFDATYSVSATLTDINSNGTIDKANVAQTWVSAADANIRDVVFAYNAEEGITNVSVDLDALSGRITSQVFAISGLEGDVYTTKQAALLQEYYLHLVRIGGDTGNAKLALADSQLRAYVDENGEAVAEQITELTAISSGNTAQLVEVNSAIANEAEVRLTSFTSLQGDIGDVDARVDDVVTLNLSDTTALIQRFINVEADVGTASGLIQDVINLDILPSSVLANKFTTIEGQINDPSTGLTASSGRIDDVINLDLAPESALISKFTTIEGAVYDGETTNPLAQVLFDDVISLDIDSESVLAQRFTTIEGQIADSETGLVASSGRIDDVINLDLSPTSALLARFTVIEADVADLDAASSGSIADVLNLDISPTTALAQKFTTIEASVVDAEDAAQALFNDVVNFTVSPTSVIANKFTTIEASVNDVDLRVDDVLSLSISPVSALATKFTTIEGVINDPVTGVAASSGLIDDILNLTVSPASALLERFTSLESTVYDGESPAWSAGISNLETALAYDDGAIAISASDVYVVVEGVTQGIQEYAEVVAQEAVDGSPVTALWTVKTTIGDLSAGFGLYNNGSYTSFLVNAQRFSIISPIDGTATPLLTTIEDDPEIPDGVYIDTAYIQDAYIVNLVSATINADYINALDVDVAGKLTASGVDFNGGTFVVTPSGAVEAKNITIKDNLGNIILSSGGTVNIDYSELNGLPTLGSLASQSSVDYATQVTNKNTIFRQTTTPSSGVKSGDLWFDTDDNLLYRRGASTWDLIGPSSLGDLDGTASTKLNNIQDGATQNIIIRQNATPSVGAYSIGDIWVTTSSPQKLYIHDGSAWQLQSNNTTNTNELTDGASLGSTAVWSSVTGTGKPSDNADVTSSAFTRSILEANGGISNVNYTTFINAAYIKDLLVDQLIAANIYAENIEGDVVDSSVVDITSQITVNASTSLTVFSIDIDKTNSFPRIFVLSGARVKHDNGSGPTSNFTAQLVVDGSIVKSYSFVDTTESRNESITLAAYIPKTATTGVHTVAFKIVTGSDDMVFIPPQSIFFNLFKEGSSYSNLVVYGDTTNVPPGEPDPDCVCEDMFLVDGLTAKDAKSGDLIDVTNGGWLEPGQIKAIKHGVVRPCIKITSESGAVWKGSIDTPITRPDGSVFYPRDALGELVHVCIDGVEYWEIIAATEELGELPIVHIYVGDISYAAGLDANKRIVTHNIYWKP